MDRCCPAEVPATHREYRSRSRPSGCGAMPLINVLSDEGEYSRPFFSGVFEQNSFPSIYFSMDFPSWRENGCCSLFPLLLALDASTSVQRPSLALGALQAYSLSQRFLDNEYDNEHPTSKSNNPSPESARSSPVVNFFLERFFLGIFDLRVITHAK